MDVCCLNRPFDDQSQDKVRLETEAIVSILGRCSTGKWQLIGSNIIDNETNKNTDADKRRKVSLFLKLVAGKIEYNAEIKVRGAKLREAGVKLFDSLHLASAEYAKVDVFLTTDARLVKAAARSDVRIRVANPLDYYMEVLNDEQFSN
jgi:predicted nucleic acid-binding protein